MDNSGKLKALLIDLPMEKSDYFHILAKENSASMQAGLVTLKPGEDVGSHNTEEYEEIVIFLEGKGEIESEGMPSRKVNRGQAAYNPPHTEHNIRNTGENLLKYIYVVAKAE
ncbi:MAG: cupin domain-containing protein [candidate division Zixibacteria bacterium]|nr:cupin domain-containing protein [candidate division Zixibacteria bacterium]